MNQEHTVTKPDCRYFHSGTVAVASVYIELYRSGFSPGVFGHSVALCFHVEALLIFSLRYLFQFPQTKSGRATCAEMPRTFTYLHADRGDHMADIRAFFKLSSKDTAVEETPGMSTEASDDAKPPAAKRSCHRESGFD